jgi:hypothetical protein
MTWKCTNTPKGENKLYSDAKGVVPSLDLRFAEGKNLNDYMTGQNLITFSRSSIGTYVDENGIIQTATADTPRFDHDPTTGESLGLLVEESRTNINDYSVDTSSWTNTTGGSISITPNAGIAPDNTNTATLIATSTGSGFIGNAASYTSGSTYTFSAYFKAGTGDQATILLTSSGGTAGRWNNGTSNLARTFDLTNGTSSTSGFAVPPTDWSIVDAGNGWWRCSITATATLTFTASQQIARNTVGNTTFYGWGWQIEEGDFPTSYIPTTGTALTRSADVASITGSNFSSWCNQSEGTVYWDGTCAGELGFGYTINDGTSNNRHGLNSGTIYGQPFVQINNVVTNLGIAPTVAAGGGKVSYGYKASDYNAYGDGTALTATSPVSVPPGLIELAIGFRGNYQSDAFLNGTISRLTYFPYRLPDSTLQTITTP